MRKPVTYYSSIPIMCGAAIFFAAPPVTGADSVNPADFPNKPIRVVVGFAPGGGADAVNRVVAQKMSENLRLSVVIENRAGAGGSIGAAYVANSAPDGYTLLGVSSSFSVIPVLYKDLSFDPVKDLAAVSLIVEAPLLVVVHPSLPARSIKELIALAKAKPGQLNYASGGEGTSGFLAGELFNNLAKVNIVHVPYKGAGPALIDVMSGEVQINFSSVLTSLPHVRRGALRALAVTSVKRSGVLPELPTVADSGLKGYSRTTWYGMLAPARTSPAIVNKLSAEISRAVNAPDMKHRFEDDGGEPAGSSPRQFQDFVVSEIALARQISEKAGLKK